MQYISGTVSFCVLMLSRSGILSIKSISDNTSQKEHIHAILGVWIFYGEHYRPTRNRYKQIEAASETGSVFMPIWDAIKGGVQAFAAVCIALLYGWVFIALGIAAMLIILRLRKRRRKDKAEKVQ